MLVLSHKLVFLAVVLSQSLCSCSSVQDAHNLQAHLTDPGDAAVERFAGFLRIPTVSSRTAPDHTRDPETFAEGRKYLESSFPDVWKALDVETVANHSLLLTWSGSDPSLDPVLFISHQDVVPADDVDLWSVPPFSGLVQDGQGVLYRLVWGRGAIDTKFSLTAMLEATTDLLASGYKPGRTIMFGFGHDEEVGGGKGAASIAKLLASRGVQLAMINDEGGMLSLDGLSPLTSTPVALIGVAEKVTVKGTGGHSSAPPLDRSTVADRMARVILAVDRRPPRTRLVAPTTWLLKALAPVAPRSLRWILRHCDSPLVGPALAKYMASKSAEMAGVVRTTVAPTVLEAGSADNVLPQQGSVIFNFRPMPDELEAFPREFIEEHIGEDRAHSHIEYVGEYGPPSRVSAADGPHWAVILAAANETFSAQDSWKTLSGLAVCLWSDRYLPERESRDWPSRWSWMSMQEAVVAPYLMTGSTDSKNYRHLVNGGIYRFSPLQLSMKAGDTHRIHGLDERVTVSSYLQAIVFYEKLIGSAGRLS